MSGEAKVGAAKQETLVNEADNWDQRSKGMRWKSCMWYFPMIYYIARCRKHAHTRGGWPVMFDTDWCGDHKLNELSLSRTT